jgi:hypothetical protein
VKSGGWRAEGERRDSLSLIQVQNEFSSLEILPEKKEKM